MKLTVIHGSPRKGNTYHAAQQFLTELRKCDADLAVREFFLPQDLPEFCRGCMACVLKSETLCPHAKYVQPILEAMLESDALLFTTPVYVMAPSGGMKNFLDHFPYLYMVHRPRPEMFRKKAAILSTAAGAGMRSAMKPIAVSLRYWGVGTVCRLGFRILAENWDDIPPERAQKNNGRLKKAARKFYSSVQKNPSRPPVSVRLMFHMFRSMHARGWDIPADRGYWERQGWLGNKRPY